MSGLDLDALTEDWAAVKRLPRQTGLTPTVWITENQGYRYDARAKVSRLHSGGGVWPDSVSVTVRPVCEEAVPPGHQPELPTDELAQVCAWIALNRDVIIAFWDGSITSGGALARLRRLP